MKKHLNLEGRSFIASSLKLGMSLGKIAKELGVSVSTVSREIKKHTVVEHKSCYGRTLNNCAKAKECTLTSLCENNPDCVDRRCASCGRCNVFCPEFVQEKCVRLSKPPYVCNGCKDKNRCRLDKHFYDPVTAEHEYRSLLVNCRSGFNMTQEELVCVDEVVTPLIRNMGQSPYTAVLNNRSCLRCSESTVYRLINADAIAAKRIDLPRAVRLKPRKSAPKGAKVERNCRNGRTYDDYLSFRAANPDASFAELDSVAGNRGGAVLFTVVLQNCNFMLAFYREHNNAQSVIDVFNRLYDILPAGVYHSMFGYLLTDNGSEFSNPSAIEFAPDGTKRSVLFYCNPSSPYQKGKIEKNHELLRQIFPKGKSLNGFTQQQINLALSHINSYGRRIFNGLSPTEMFVAMYGEEVLHLLGQTRIQPNDVVLKPWLING